jgi:hypothetical protein
MAANSRTTLSPLGFVSWPLGEVTDLVCGKCDAPIATVDMRGLGPKDTLTAARLTWADGRAAMANEVLGCHACGLAISGWSVSVRSMGM